MYKVMKTIHATGVVAGFIKSIHSILMTYIGQDIVMGYKWEGERWLGGVNILRGKMLNNGKN